MIRPIDIRLNAAHPDLPLAEAVTYTGAPSTVLIRGVPGNCGRWAITAVFVAATFPDGSTSTRTAVQSANGVWVATLPATATSGRTAHGLRILADGADENGEAVGGYVLGVADFAVASLAVTPAPEPGETSWQMLYFDAVPGVLRKGDVTKVDGVLKIYNGTAWEAFANVPAPSTSTPSVDNGSGSAGSSASYARGDHVHPTDTSRMAATATGADIPASTGSDLTIQQSLEANATAIGSIGNLAEQTAQGLSTHTSNTTIHVTATEKSTWNGKQDALTAQQLANIAAVSNALAFDATHSYAAGDPVVYNGTLYTFTAAHTGAWTGSDVSAVDIIARLAGKLDNTGNQTLDGSLTLLGIALTNGTIIYNGSTFSLSPWMGGTLALMAHIAPDFSAQSSYEVGQLVVQNFILKRCTTAGTGSAAVFASATVEDVLAALRTGKADTSALLDKLDSTSAAPAFSTSSTYAVGEHVTYNGALYRCTTAVTTAGAWTGSANWTADTASNYFQYALATKTIDNGAVTLDDHAMNAVAVSSALASLTINFPTATSGRVRDFGLRLSVASGITTAPELVLPQGITCENADGEVPEIGADGAVTILYFTETAANVFLVKGEVVTAIS